MYKILCKIICKFRNLGLPVPDKLFLGVSYYLSFGSKLNLHSPKSYNEKLQWLKLYDRNPLYHILVDKLKVKEYVKNKIGEEYVIKTLKVWESVDDINLEDLPERFVLKTTNGGGNTGVAICTDKSHFNLEEVKKKLQWSLKFDIYKYSGEWAYKGVTKKIIAEEYIEPRFGMNDLPDYKFFCVNGEVKALFVATERQNPSEEVKFDFFDSNFNHLPFRQGHEHAKILPQKPVNFDRMKQIASVLSQGIPHVRVDLYDLGDKVLFGEFTMYHFGGFVPFDPIEWDKRFCDIIGLSDLNCR